ncbi:SANT and BTB domain regulator of class switch recombination [Anopheles cruzii]|uniref:SANT and BTB domain regulator of class switch recombination n=1 Tax=Anopheles cruzii TaxID=68878 RepID=UPI0022EC9178|nr:SANT and BTB domain regulator of class switch recombination [Anopheles cruzii]XP_052861834.1 SANT and BTB domain regulator of class switch recombination [Anopheles cruzii]XP_052861835.1 SANT and BTB domain regulator of class switch recombination [Anopheles cruzii]XP_052861836.1 SANT and BTB domain regulator of class switch recombination [Anopheles cruzii]XP_052861837.1 SANT and BTB domain regulator of class switch recombination [Anopheles cruzii]XP_052861838.1 SANT and BTB domain regulator 
MAETLPTDKNDSISMHDFLEFLNVTCQVNDSFNNCKKNLSTFDYNQLARNELVSNIQQKSLQDVGNPTDGTSVASPIKNPTVPMGLAKKDSKSTDDNALVVLRSPTGKKMLMKKRIILQKSQKSKAEPHEVPKSKVETILNEKLDVVLNEGILDSVLPFVCPSNGSGYHHHRGASGPKATSTNMSVGTGVSGHKPGTGDFNTHSTHSTPETQLPNTASVGGKKSTISAVGDVSQNFLIASSSTKTGVRRKSSIAQIAIPDSRSEPEVIIHVCDEVKGSSKDFTCPQKLLVSKMGYFADVTAGQRLEDMDISVHCDLQIFEWLMKWVKRESVTQEDWPALDPTNVIPILVSASFLQMEPLLLDCLSFCHARLNEVVKASANLACLNDSIITRLAAMFTNLELELVKDKKDRIAPRLWTKLIQCLCENEPQALRGHYATLVGMFRCLKCGKFLTQTVATYLHCLPQNIRLNRWGQLISAHMKDPSWNVTNYVSSLHKELRSWRKVYWRLWGNCHFLYCSTCDTHFPVSQMMWCQYHPEQPQFLGPAAEGRVAGPAGRFPCCGKHAYRYETLPGPTGCLFREHTVQVDTDRDRAVLQLALHASDGGCLYEPPPFKHPNSSADPWWNGIGILPHRSRQGLLPTFHVDSDAILQNRSNHRNMSQSLMDTESDSDSEEYDKSATNQSRSTTSSSDGEESEYSSTPSFHQQHHLQNHQSNKDMRRKSKLSYGRNWAGDMSARSNQDNQREFEERAMKQIIALVGKRTGGEQNLQYQAYQHGGMYIRLETDWRESIKQKNLSSLKIKTNGGQK